MQFPDSRMPTEEERQGLIRMLYYALLEIRLLGPRGMSEQAADLADAFHEMPALLWSKEFSFNFFRKFLEGYHERDGASTFDYLAMLDEISKGATDDGVAI